MNGLQASQPHYPFLQHGLRLLAVTLSDNPTLDDPTISDVPLGDISHALEYAIGRCSFQTHKGYIGLAPSATRAGDVVGIPLERRRPNILRPIEDFKGGRTWLVVGPC